MDAQDREMHELPLDNQPNRPKPVVENQGMLTVRQSRAQSYEQRRHIEKNREHIDAYHTAGVIHGYRHLAKDARSAQQVVRSVATVPIAPQRVSPLAQATDGSRKRSPYHSSPFARSQSNETVGPHGNARGVHSAPKKSFTEPSTRKYNPYA